MNLTPLEFLNQLCILDFSSTKIKENLIIKFEAALTIKIKNELLELNQQRVNVTITSQRVILDDYCVYIADTTDLNNFGMFDQFNINIDDIDVIITKIQHIVDNSIQVVEPLKRQAIFNHKKNKNIFSLKSSYSTRLAHRRVARKRFILQVMTKTFHGNSLVKDKVTTLENEKEQQRVLAAMIYSSRDKLNSIKNNRIDLLLSLVESYTLSENQPPIRYVKLNNSLIATLNNQTTGTETSININNINTSNLLSSPLKTMASYQSEIERLNNKLIEYDKQISLANRIIEDNKLEILRLYQLEDDVIIFVDKKLATFDRKHSQLIESNLTAYISARSPVGRHGALAKINWQFIKDYKKSKEMINSEFLLLVLSYLNSIYTARISENN